MVFALAALAAGLYSWRAPAAACPVRIPPPMYDASGVYDSTYGDMVLTQSGRRVTGTFACCGGGSITGRYNGDSVIRFTWSQPGFGGQGVWRVEASRLTGSWGWDKSTDSGGAWNLVKRGKPLALRP